MTALLNPSDFPALYAFDISHWLLTVFPVPWFSTLATGAGGGGFGEGLVLGAWAPGGDCDLMLRCLGLLGLELWMIWLVDLGAIQKLGCAKWRCAAGA